MVYAIDGRERWLVHNYMRPGEGDFDDVDRDACLRTILGVDDDFKYEILSKEDWYGRRLIASKFRNGCAFIAGDAAHIWVPYAGYGMNAGIADAMNLSWLLAAHLNGWAPSSILDAYEAERWPITSQVSKFAMSHAEAEIRRRGAVPPDIEDDGPEGKRVRGEVGRLTYEINVQQYAAAGLNFGTYYDASPVIAYDGAEHPAYTMNHYTPSTVPGCRTPHFWRADGGSLYDAMGPEFTLLRFDPGADVAALEAAARSRGVPLKVLDLERPDGAGYDGHSLVLSRPDQHVAWRGDRVPADPLDLIDRVRGVVPRATVRGATLSTNVVTVLLPSESWISMRTKCWPGGTSASGISMPAGFRVGLHPRSQIDIRLLDVGHAERVQINGGAAKSLEFELQPKRRMQLASIGFGKLDARSSRDRAGREDPFRGRKLGFVRRDQHDAGAGVGRRCGQNECCQQCGAEHLHRNSPLASPNRVLALSWRARSSEMFSCRLR